MWCPPQPTPFQPLGATRRASRFTLSRGDEKKIKISREAGSPLQIAVIMHWPSPCRAFPRQTTPTPTQRPGAYARIQLGKVAEDNIFPPNPEVKHRTVCWKKNFYRKIQSLVWPRISKQTFEDRGCAEILRRTDKHILLAWISFFRLVAIGKFYRSMIHMHIYTCFCFPPKLKEKGREP